MPPKKTDDKPDEIRTMELRPEDREGAKPDDKLEESKKDEKSPVDKVVAEVEPKTDPLQAVEALVRHMAMEFEAAAPEAEAIAGQFSDAAGELARAVWAGVEEKLAAANAERGFGLQKQSRQAAPDQPSFADPPHNEAAVRSAVAHGMDENEARAMTHMGANT